MPFTALASELLCELEVARALLFYSRRALGLWSLENVSNAGKVSHAYIDLCMCYVQNMCLFVSPCPTSFAYAKAQNRFEQCPMACDSQLCMAYCKAFPKRIEA